MIVLAAAKTAADVANEVAASASQNVESAKAATEHAVQTSNIWPHLPTHWPAQTDLLTWTQNMGALTAAVLLIGGLVFLLFGVYAYRGLVTINAAVLGAYVGGLIGEKAGNAVAGSMVGGFAAAALTWPMMKYAVAIMGGLFGLLLGASIWRAGGLDSTYAWSGGLSGLIFCGMLSFLLFRGSVMMYTSLQGAVMLVFGLLGLLYKYQDLGPKVSENLSVRPFLLPLFIFIPATLGLIYQQTQFAAGPPAKK